MRQAFNKSVGLLGPRCTAALAVAAILLLSLGASESRAQDVIPPALKSAVYRHAPFIIHEVKGSGLYPRQSDHLLATDFDGNRYGPDNSSNAVNNGALNPTATVYYAATESGLYSDRGYYFITYSWYHARDNGWFFWYYGAPVDNPGHDNDMEGAFFVIKKSPYFPYGVIATVATEAHGALIPYVNPSTIVAVGNPAGSSGYAGYTEFWTDPRYPNQRSVVALRGADHGSYMAQDCSGKSVQLDHGFGMYRGSVEDFGTYAACIHDDSQWMLYRPATEWQPSGSVVPAFARNGIFDYALTETATSTMWWDRFQYGSMFTGAPIDIGNGGGYALTYFLNSQGTYEANPPWNWKGGSGECVLGRCYYSFGYDATGNFYSPVPWPTNYSPGSIFTDPRLEAGLRFPSLPELQDRQCYNPYVTPRPVCTAPAPLELSIMGPNQVSLYATNTWQAFVYGGTPPYTYSWSGALSGSGAQISGSIADPYSDDLFLTVTDAAGQTIYGSVSITVCVTGTPC